MLKKSMVLIIAMVMVFSMAACASNNNASKPENGGSSNTPNNSNNGNTGENAEAPALAPEEGAKLLVWDDPAEIEYTKAVAQAFEEKYGVPVTVEGVPAPDQANELANRGPALLGADVVMFPHDKLGIAASSGLILPNDVFAEETIASNAEAAILASSFEDRLYGYPKSIETYALLYNKDLVTELPETFEELAAFAEEFTDKDARKYGLMWEAKSLYYNHMFMAPYGGYIFGNNGTDINDIGLDNAGSVEGIKYYQELSKILPVNVDDITSDVKNQLFQENKLAFNIDGPWAVGSHKGKVNFGVMPLPKLPNGKEPVTLSGVRSYYVNSYTEYPNASKLFASFATNKENALLNFEMTGILPANTEASEDPKIKEDEILSGYIEQFKHSVPMPSVPEMNSVWEPLQGAFTAVWDDGADVEQSLNNAVKTLKEKIQ
ncbi:sugar ABC transporter substrate-binding protein [Marinicrinis sediminis]|uniref:Maltodextrin-binding protein n=1 Tax=Marinicrinis sediminis TaxID=1652465 RepID=A0ABW5R7Y1_9BACL